MKSSDEPTGKDIRSMDDDEFDRHIQATNRHARQAKAEAETDSKAEGVRDMDDAAFDKHVQDYNKHATAEMQKLIENMDAKNILSVVTTVKQLALFFKYTPDAKLNEVFKMDAERFLERFNQVVSDEDNRTIYKYFSDTLPADKANFLADKILSSIRMILLTGETEKYDTLLFAIRDHVSPEAQEIRGDLVVRNLAPEEMIKHVFGFRENLLKQKEHILKKLENPRAYPSDESTTETISSKDMIILRKCNNLDGLIKQIDEFTTKPEISSYKRLVQEVKANSIPLMDSLPKYGLFSRLTATASGTTKILKNFANEADEIIQKLGEPKVNTATSAHRR